MSRKPLAWLNRRRPASVLCVVFALMFGYFAFEEIALRWDLQQRGVVTEAVILPRQTEAHLVRFPVKGSSVEVELGRGQEPLEPGRVIVIVYDPANPARNMDVGLLNETLIPAITAAAALLFLGLGALTWFKVIDWERISR